MENKYAPSFAVQQYYCQTIKSWIQMEQSTVSQRLQERQNKQKPKSLYSIVRFSANNGSVRECIHVPNLYEDHSENLTNVHIFVVSSNIRYCSTVDHKLLFEDKVFAHTAIPNAEPVRRKIIEFWRRLSACLSWVTTGSIHLPIDIRYTEPIALIVYRCILSAT